ncbi:MAG: phosphoribosylglycinamide synthetase C domain-containing protein, partial [Deltaproteobacteria bacterium]
SYPNHSLPFVNNQDIVDGLAITQKVATAILQETGTPYKGVMYAGFMVTKDGIKLLEYNARFGDPEAMNILPLLKTDFVDLCFAIVNGTLENIEVEFEHKATVCKYVVPKGYGLPENHPDNSYTSKKLMIGDVGEANLYYASVEEKEDGIYMSSSRAIGVVGISASIEEAQIIAQQGVEAIGGEVAHRNDIGTTELIERRITHMQTIKGNL